MTKRTLVLGAVAALALAGLAVASRTWYPDGTVAQLLARLGSPEGAVAQAPGGSGGGRVVPVEVATATKKAVPVRVDAIGTVTPIASVAIKPRLETVITAVHFEDGATVKQGDLLFTLDSRQIEAEIKRVEAVIAGAQAQLEQAEADVARYTELVSRNATTVVTLKNAQTQVNINRALAASNRATLENLRVQLDYTKIRAPISGRISMAAVKVGNFVRPGDTAALATINQMKPVYVAFAVPQRILPDVRQAVAAGTTRVRTNQTSEAEPDAGRVTMIENTVDASSGMVTIRATMDNVDEILWPGTLVNAQLTLRVEDTVTIPSAAVQVGQTGRFVFVVKNGVASVQPVVVARTIDGEAVISEGLNGGETVVTDGQLLLGEGVRVAPRAPRVGS
jgi:membrane fusion protein, multidrug efflux system